MKTNGERNNGGKLKPEYRKRWAEYICRYIEKYRSRGHLWHFTHFLKAGAQRIGVTRYTDKIEMTAFEKDGRITVVLLNRTEEEIPVYLRLGEYCAELTSKAKSIMTAEIENKKIDIGNYEKDSRNRERNPLFLRIRPGSRLTERWKP